MRTLLESDLTGCPPDSGQCISDEARSGRHVYNPVRYFVRRRSSTQHSELSFDCLSPSGRSAKYGVALVHQVAVLGCEGPRALVEAGMVGALMRFAAGQTEEISGGVIGGFRKCQTVRLCHRQGVSLSDAPP